MTDAHDVLSAAERRAAALVGGDEAALRELLHPAFTWTSHRGDRFDRDAYLRSNRSGHTRWRSQSLTEPAVTVVGNAAVIVCRVVDELDLGEGVTSFSMPMTQLWVHDDGTWRLLAGHAGPLDE